MLATIDLLEFVDILRKHNHKHITNSLDDNGGYGKLEADVFELFADSMSEVNERAPIEIDDVNFNYARTVLMVVNGNGSIETKSDSGTHHLGGEEFDKKDMSKMNNLFGTLLAPTAHGECVRFEDFGTPDENGVPKILHDIAHGITNVLSRAPERWLTIFREALADGYSTPKEIRKLLKRPLSSYSLRDMLLVFRWVFNGIEACDGLSSLEQRFRNMTKQQKAGCE